MSILVDKCAGCNYDYCNYCCCDNPRCITFGRLVCHFLHQQKKCRLQVEMHDDYKANYYDCCGNYCCGKRPFDCVFSQIISTHQVNSLAHMPGIEGSKLNICRNKTKPIIRLAPQNTAAIRIHFFKFFFGRMPKAKYAAMMIAGAPTTACSIVTPESAEKNSTSVSP